MDICQNRGHEAGQLHGARTAGAVAAGAGLALVLLAGCASPGPPLPPSLKLPEVVSDLTASRVGDAVTLRWTTPSRTTDKLTIAGPVEAEICRTTLTIAAAQPASAVTTPCSPVVVRVKATAGASQAVDTLPAALTAGPARLLAYRVQLRNTAGRTAGASAAAFAASGAAPTVVEELHGRATKAGVVLEWRPETQETGNREQGTGGTEAVELDRTILQPPTATATTTTSVKATATPSVTGSARKLELPGATKQPQEERLRVGNSGSSAAEMGGTIDRTVQFGNTYRYSAQRVLTVTLGGHTLEVRSAPSAEVTVAMLDVFPPDAPAGLIAVPGFTGGPAAGQGAGQGAEAPATESQRPAIDLSWEPDLEPHVAGYRVYRRDLDSSTPNTWRLLDTELVPVAAYRDLSVAAGQRYAYRVSAVSDAGNESAPSDEVVETAPAATA